MYKDMHAIALCLAGELNPQQEQTLLLLCEAAASELCARLRPGVRTQDCYEALVCAGAYLALSRFDTAAGNDIGSFEAGSIKLTRQSARQSAPALTAAARQLIAPYTEPDGFAFRGVRG